MHTAQGLITNSIVHNLSLAVAYGGPAFAGPLRTALLQGVTNDKERGKAMQVAWTEFYKVNVPAHIAIAATWLAERSAIKRFHGESKTTNNLVTLKDALVAGALVTVMANAVAGRMMKRDFPDGAPIPSEGNVTPADAAKIATYSGFFRIVGTLNRALVGGAIAAGPLIGASIIRSSARRGMLARLFKK